jgi:hypothetical protein
MPTQRTVSTTRKPDPLTQLNALLREAGSKYKGRWAKARGRVTACFDQVTIEMSLREFRKTAHSIHAEWKNSQQQGEG